MPLSSSTSCTSVSDLLGSPGKAQPARRVERGCVDVDRWAEESLSAIGLPSPQSKLARGLGVLDGAASSPELQRLKLEVATEELGEYKARARQLEAQVRQLHAELEEARGIKEAAKSSQALLVERIQELETQLRKTAESEQAKAAQLARLEGRAAVAEGSLKAAEQQVSQALGELQMQRAKELAELEAKHARELQSLQEQHSSEMARLKAGCEDRVAELAREVRAAEAAAQKEQQRSRELAAQLDKVQSRGEAVKELMRHSEELQGQVDRLQQTLQEERRRANKVAQAAESTLAAEKRLAEAAALELQGKLEEAAREQERAVRQAKAKLQRAETDLRGVKLHSSQLAERVAELEALLAQKNLQLDSAAQEVSAMQRELQGLREGLSSRDAAALDAARTQFASALDAMRTDLQAARQQLSEQELLVRRQGAALGSVADILAVHAEGGEGCAGSGAGARQHGVVRWPVDPEKVVAFVEAVSGTMQDLHQQWDLERQELASSLGAADAAREQLEAQLAREQEETQRTAERLRGQLESARASHEALQRDVDACRTELTRAVAKAAAAVEDCSKWKSTVSGMEVQLREAQQAADAARQEAVQLRAAMAAKEERVKEMRSAMATAMDDKCSTASDLQLKLTTLQQAEQELERCRMELAQYSGAATAACQAATGAAPKLQQLLHAMEGQHGPAAEQLSAVLSAVLRPALAAVQSVASPGAGELAVGGLAGLGSAVLQLCEALGHMTDVMQERAKIHHILSTVNAKLRAATVQHRSLLTAGEKGQPVVEGQGTASLVALLQQLTENVVGLIESLAVEKECIASEMMHVADENQLLQNQIQSMQSVLASLQSDTNVEQQLADAMVAWNQAQARVAGLEAENAQLLQRLAQAQQTADSVGASSAQEWAGMRDDIARLVQHAEQAQIEAEAAVARLRSECDERVEQLQQEVAKATEARAASEEMAADLRRQLNAAHEQLQRQSQTETAAQDAAHAALADAQLGMQQLEGQVAQLHRKLVLRARVGVSALSVKKAVAASSRAALLKRENERLGQQQKELQEKVATLEGTIRQGAQQLKQSRERAAAAQAATCDARAKIAHLEALLRKVDERKASVEVERRKAQEAVARLEQQVLELQCKLETAQHRERMAQADAEQLRTVLARREQEAKQLSGAMQQVEVAEVALRDSHAAASKLLQECTEARVANQELQSRVQALTRQLADAQHGHASAVQQVQDLQEAFDTALTELDIARSLLAAQRQQEPQPASRHGAAQQLPEFRQDVVAFPMAMAPAQASSQQQQAVDELMRQILGAKNKLPPLAQGGCTPPIQPGCAPAAEQEGSAKLSPLTQQRIRTPCTPLTAKKTNCASALHMADDASSHRPTPEPGGGCADENWPQEPQQAPAKLLGCSSRPGSAADAASHAGLTQQQMVEDMRGLMLAVESLQRQLAVKNDRIRELRAALQQQQQQQQATLAAGGSRPGSAEAFVLQQKLESAAQQLESTRALAANLEMQLEEARRAKVELQQRLARFEQQLAAVENDAEAGQAEIAASKAAQERADLLAVQLAERDAMMEALQAQLVSRMAGARSCAGTQTEDGEAGGGEIVPTAGALAAVSRPASRAEGGVPLAAAAAAAACSPQALGALGGLDRIVGLWKRACVQKDRQIRELQGRLSEAQDGLADAEAAHDALLQSAQDSAAAVHSLEQQLAEAQAQLAAGQCREGDFASRVSQLEQELAATQQEAGACRERLQESQRQQLGAERQCSSLQQQLDIAQAQVREVQHAAALEQASRGDADALRQQLAATRLDLEAAREAAAASHERVESLSRQLEEQQQAAAAANASGATAAQLSRRLEAAQAAEQQLLREAQDAAAALAATQREAAELQAAATVRDAQLRHACERLEATEGQLRQALEAVGEQNAALAEMQQALEQARQEHQVAAAIAMEHQQAAAGLLAARQELTLMQQRLEVAEKQMEVLRAQLSNAEGDKTRAAAERQRLQTQESRLNDAMLRYQAGLATLSSALSQLQSADSEGGGLDALAVLGHYRAQGSGGTAGGELQLSAEEMVDEILFYVHRRDCDITALVAQVGQLEAAVAGKARDVSELRGKLQAQAGSVSRVKEQLQWCMRECEALKRQLADKDETIALLRSTAAPNSVGMEGTTGSGYLMGASAGRAGSTASPGSMGALGGGWASLPR